MSDTAEPTPETAPEPGPELAHEAVPEPAMEAAPIAGPVPESLPGAERHEFGAEVGRLLDLVVHSLYSEREIFLRELVANAADATDRRRFEALTDKALGSVEAPRIRIAPDKEARTLTITDDGIGMGRDELVSNLGTIARSGTRAFGQALEAAGETAGEKPSLIGQFGVGFYAAFMVADRVDVTSRRAGGSEAWLWSSDGRGAYTLAPSEREEAGTTIVLHMKADATEFLESYRLETIVRKWADGIALPVVVVRDGKDVVANEGTALWRRSKSEVTKEQYQELYRHVSHAFDEPWATLHWRAEGALEFAALLFVPGMRPFEAVEGVRESRVRLHVRRMFITDEAALLPPWLRFVQGVVDTDDLPLNVSREMLQATPVLARIRKAVCNRVLSELKSRAKDATDYGRFWENFGPVLKEGVWEDHEHRAALAELMRFRTSAPVVAGEPKADGAEDAAETEEAPGGLVSLAQYVGRMRPGQEAIYFLAGENRDALAASPQLEGFRARGIEVLLLDDPVDSFWPERLDQYEGKPLRSVTQGAADLSKLPVEGVEAEAEPEGQAAAVDALLERLKAALGEAVEAVRTTDRLTHSAVVLAASESGPDLQMQRLMRRAARPMASAAPILEVNPRHALIRRLAAVAAEGGEVEEAALTLLDLARVQDGEAPRDPAAFARRVTAALAR